jgi:UDP:flavonoid glycosyltransferase YjiC (YdhE family)
MTARRILFASMPLDGHFSPLTGLAVHLRERGHDVRFYTGLSYTKKLAALGIPHLSSTRGCAARGRSSSHCARSSSETSRRTTATCARRRRGSRSTR